MTDSSAGFAFRARVLVKRWAMPLAVLWTLAILTALLIPGSYLPSGRLWSWDKVAHFVLFAGFAGLWMIAVGESLGRATIYIIVLGVAYGAFTEIGQELAPGGRHGSLMDALANTAGVLVGVGVYALWRRVHPKPEG